MDDTVDSVDRISQLPPSIIHEIMSRLRSVEVARTSVLSKKWYDLHRSFPILDFEYAYSYYRLKDHLKGREALQRNNIEEFIKLVDASLLRFWELDLSMLLFRLCVDIPSIQESVLDEWIRSVVEKGVQELDIEIPTVSLYTLPELVFSAKSLTALSLGRCKLERPMNSIRLDSLKSLVLQRVYINDEMLYRLTRECKWLEELLMKDCEGIKCFHVSEAYRLRIIKVAVFSDEIESFKIVVPNLQELLLSSFISQRTKIDIDSCIEVKTLALFGFNLTDHELRDLILKFPSLENLKLVRILCLENFTIANGLLKNLNISTCHDLKVIDIDTPNLVSFTFMYNLWPVSYKIKAHCPWKIYVTNRDKPNTSWYLNVKEFIQQSSEMEDLTFDVTSKKISFNFEEFKRGSTSASVPCKVGNLFLETPKTNYATFLDGLFSICSPKILRVLVAEETDIKFFKWLVETMMKRDATNCCNANEDRCWRHYLSDIKIRGEQKCFNSDNLMDSLSCNLTGSVHFHLDWCYSEI